MINQTIKLISVILEYFKHRNIGIEQESKRKDIRMIRAYLNNADFAESQGWPIVADYLRKKANIIIKYPN